MQVAERIALSPLIDRERAYLPPELTLVAQFVLAVFSGLLGVALAAPLAAALVVLVTMPDV